MSRQQAIDSRYGRRGGAWAADGVLNRITDLNNARKAHVKAGRRSCSVGGPCRWCDPDDPAFDTARTPTTDEDWAGLARMAAARRSAGQPLTTTDLEALRRHPNPPSGLTRSTAA